MAARRVCYNLRIVTCAVFGAIAVGAVFPDLDWFYNGHTRAWDPYLAGVAVLLVIVAGASLYRLSRERSPAPVVEGVE